MTRSHGVCGLLLGACVGLSACSSGVNAAGDPVPAGPQDQVSGTLTVQADPSLSDIFSEVAGSLEREHPKVRVRVTYSETPSAGDGVDVVASSSRQDLDRLERQGVLGPASIVAQQLPALVVAPGNPGHVNALGDLGRPGVSAALCATDTTCGQATDAMLERADVAPGQVRRVSSTQEGLRTVAAGTVDAAVVWAGDVRGASGQSAAGRGVRQVSLAPPRQQNIRLEGAGSRPVLIAVATEGNQRAAMAFVDQFHSELGQHLLRSDGFR